VLEGSSAPLTLLIGQNLTCDEDIKCHARGCDRGTLVVVSPPKKIVGGAV